VASELREEVFVRRLLFDRFGAELRKLPKGSTKTADYELMASGSRIAVVEVKTLEAQPMSEARGWTIEHQSEHTWSGTRRDNAPRRVASHVHGAAKQLEHYTNPKVLVFLNEESFADVRDLDEAVQGTLMYGSESAGYVINTASMRIAEGRIRDERWLIDLYIWIEPRRGPRTVFPVNAPVERHPATEETVAFRVTSAAGLAIAQRVFGCPGDI
jgi:hypothetical protein